MGEAEPVTSEDTDGDGVPDSSDQCNNPECSKVDSRGCPKDSDSDGVTDCDDNCPNEEGDPLNDGCPVRDSDGDGVSDDRDNCHNPGCTFVDSRGCPWDSNGDGIVDCEDNCPNQAGPRSNNGCPQQGPSFCLGTALLAVMMAFGGILRDMRQG